MFQGRVITELDGKFIGILRRYRYGELIRIKGIFLARYVLSLARF